MCFFVLSFLVLCAQRVRIRYFAFAARCTRQIGFPPGKTVLNRGRVAWGVCSVPGVEGRRLTIFFLSVCRVGSVSLFVSCPSHQDEEQNRRRARRPGPLPSVGQSPALHTRGVGLALCRSAGFTTSPLKTAPSKRANLNLLIFLPKKSQKKFLRKCVFNPKNAFFLLLVAMASLSVFRVFLAF